VRKFAVATLFAVALTGCITPDDEVLTQPGDVTRGRVMVEENCSGCHAVGLTGASPYAPAPPFRTLHEKYDVEGLAEAFAEGILVGHKGQTQMPEFVMTPDQIDDLLAYLKSLE
jgi:mono/diheme cytochrome c family protein